MKNYTRSTIEYYNNNHQSYFERTIKIDMQDSYNKFLSLLPKPAYILDAGCGVGRDSEYFVKSGNSVTALDASIEMVKHAQKRVPTAVLHQKFSMINFDESFDGIWTCASLLHISKKDLPSIFDKFIAALKPKGIWYISFKYGEEQTLENGRLFSRFTVKSFEVFIKKFPKLKVLEIWKSKSNIQNIHNEWLQVLARKNV